MTVVGVGADGAARARRGCEQLAAKKASRVELIDPRTVSPLDTDTILASVRKTGRLLIVDEAFGPVRHRRGDRGRVADAGFDDLDAPDPPAERRIHARRRTARAGEGGACPMSATSFDPRGSGCGVMTYAHRNHGPAARLVDGRRHLPEWLKKDGEAVANGDPLFALESDKVTMEVEALDRWSSPHPPGAPKPGDKVVVGQVLGYLLAEGESIPVAGLRAAAAEPADGR